MNDVRTWLESLELGRYVDAFAENDIDWALLPNLDHQLLKEIGVASVGHRMRILEAIAALGKPSAQSDPVETATVRDIAERRQLTVMFCDLVDSTKLSQSVDPEELSTLMAAYQDTCAQAVERFEGYVARYMGDGVLAYFGYPQAHEDDAERAIRAGLALIEAMRKVGGNPVRVGIATGPVVVGDLIGESSAQERAVVGETPNLAARLQAIAAPDQVVVSDTTHQLSSGQFRFVDLGTPVLKGLDRTVRVFRVMEELLLESRFAASHGDRLSPLVGREEEMAMLQRRWELARSGAGQVVLLCGEPGIGKSRLCEALYESVSDRNLTRCRYQCSPHHVDSAFYPVVVHLERAAGISVRDNNASRLAKLKTLLAGAERSHEEDLTWFASLLSADSREHPQSQSLLPEQRRARTLDTLVRQLEMLAKRAPVLVVFEDVHWIDPSSQDLLHRLIERLEELPILMLVTFRPEYQQSWSGLAHVTLLVLNRLDRRRSQALAEKVTGTDLLDAKTLAHVVEHTDGVPLFIEEFTRTVLEASHSGTNHSEEGAAVVVPATLHDSLMARLDRLPVGKALAQTGAVIGREFERELLSLVCDQSAEKVDAGLAELLDSGLIIPRSGIGERYQFKHALVQDAAYESLLKARRAHLHARVARVMTVEVPVCGDAEPELVAHHFETAGECAGAARWWRRAAAKVAERAAIAESVRHLQRAVAMVERCEQDLDAEETIETRLELAQALRIAEQTEAALPVLEAAETTARSHGQDLHLARIHYLRGNLYFPQGRVEACLEEHRQAYDLARQCDSVELEAVALGGLADGEYARGRMLSARRRFADCVKLARAHDLPRVLAPNLAMCGIAGFYTLEIEAGLTMVAEAISLSEALGDYRAKVMALVCRILMLVELGCFDEAEVACQETQALAQRLGAWRFETPRCQVLARIALSQGRPAEAQEILEGALNFYDRVPESFDKPRTLGLLALTVDDPVRRRAYLDEGVGIIARGCLAHSTLVFYRDAIDTCLDLQDHDGAERFARELANFTRAEALPYAKFHTARGVALAAVARGQRTKTLYVQLEELRGQAVRAGLVNYAPAIERAMKLF